MDYQIRGGKKLSENPQKNEYTMHMHDTYEIFSIFSGDADYYVEGNCYPLQHGDIILMRKSESHQIVLKSDEDYGRVVVNFDLPFLNQLDPDHRLMSMYEDRPLGQYNHYSAAMFPENNWQYYLDKISSSNELQYKLAYLLPLLGELSECFDVLKNIEQKPKNDQITAIIRYINQNIREELSLSQLCDHFYLSKAHLNRVFKRATGSTVWNYIVSKRLMLAHEMLILGETPTEVFSKCGFNDYTTFYRAYKKLFGISPKSDQSR